MADQDSSVAPSGTPADEIALLRARVEQLERFTSRLAHELTTPIVTVRGFARIVAESDLGDPVLVDALARIDRSAARAERILRTLVDEALGERRVEVLLEPLLADAVDAVRDENPDRELHLRLALDPGMQAFAQPPAVRSVATDVLRALAARTAPGILDVEITTVQTPAADTVSVCFGAVGLQFSVEERRLIEGGTAVGAVEGAADEGVGLLAAAAGLASSQAGHLWCNDADDGLGVRVVLSLPRVGDG